MSVALNLLSLLSGHNNSIWTIRQPCVCCSVEGQGIIQVPGQVPKVRQTSPIATAVPTKKNFRQMCLANVHTPQAG